MSAPFVRLLSTAALLIGLMIPAGAGASPAPPAELEVKEGAGWRPDRRFGLRWRDPIAPAPPLSAVHYVIRNPLGTVVAGPVRIAGVPGRIDNLNLSGGPGAYTAQVWLEDNLGAEGPAASTLVRFDDARPGNVAPLEEPGWIGRAELPHAIRVGHPPGPPPQSGIRGYAISIDRTATGEPCATDDRCADAETDLRGGVEEDTLLVPELPEGVSHVHAVAVSGAGVRSAATGHTTVRVDRTDPVTRLDGAPGGWTNQRVILRANATDGASGMGMGAGAAPYTAIAVDGAPPSIVAGDSVGLAIVDEGAHTVAYYARDAAGNVDDGRMANGRLNAMPRTASVRIDRSAPSVVLIGSAGARDPELIEARVADTLSGPSRTRGTIAVRAVGSGQGFAPLATVVEGETLRARWPSDDFAPGDYEFLVTGFDAAGNPASSSRRSNGSSLVLPSPLKVTARLLASVDGEIERIVGREAPSRVSGRLSLDSGEAAAGEVVVVSERFDPGSGLAERSTPLRTDEHGRFSLALPRGPSRVVVARFAGAPKLTRATSASLRLGVRSSVRLRASAPVAVVGGSPVAFSGSVPAGPGEIPADGVAIELQFRVGEAPWEEFRSLRTDRRGRFRYRYRFSDDDSRGVRFRFRAVAPTQSDWPYEPGGSRPVAVRGA